VPAPRTPLTDVDTGKQVGWTTSAAFSPMLGQTIALGYVRREVQPGEDVQVGEGGEGRARVVKLPFDLA
jgi:glycine cleavage system aminomethyltransferase T